MATVRRVRIPIKIRRTIKVTLKITCGNCGRTFVLRPGQTHRCVCGRTYG